MVSVVHFITGHAQTELNRVCYFISLIYSLLPKDLTVQNYLFIFTAAGVLKRRQVHHHSANYMFSGPMDL